MRINSAGEPDPERPEWGSSFFGDDPMWHRWTPEVLRRVGGAPRCAKPPLPGRGVDHMLHIEAWGPLLQLFSFHLGWPRVDLGLTRWASGGFADMGDPTLATIKELWGPGLASFSLWYLEHSGYSRFNLSAPLRQQLLLSEGEGLEWCKWADPVS